MSTPKATAAELLKMFGARRPDQLDLGLLRRFIEDKGFDLSAINKLAEQGFFGNALLNLVLRQPNADTGLIDNYALALPHIQPAETSPYNGSHEENGRIGKALASSGIAEGNNFIGEGASGVYFTDVRIPQSLRSVPVAVIGYGAAGILVSAALQRVGFEKITVYEKSRPLGIWAQDNVHGLSRNNPRRLQFFGDVLEPAPGDGDEVRIFLDNLATLKTVTENVTGIKPGKLKHLLSFAGGKTATYPIVINAIGMGKPKPISDPLRMTTTAKVSEAGARWQYFLRPAEAKGKRFILIGLGNSTAEMIHQIHKLIDNGYEVDYRILTHYPEAATFNPNSYVESGERVYRVFRDLSRPNLVDYQGDLPEYRHDYFRALYGGKIISNVKHWEVDGGVIQIFGPKGKFLDQLPYDRIMTLIGYQHSKETMEMMGCSYDTKKACALFDYDGEFASNEFDPRKPERLSRGYFGFGCVVETPENPNAIVIPGMLHSLGDLVFGVIMRAAEYKKTRRIR